jgi:hypothetical protein
VESSRGLVHGRKGWIVWSWMKVKSERELRKGWLWLLFLSEWEGRILVIYGRGVLKRIVKRPRGGFEILD